MQNNTNYNYKKGIDELKKLQYHLTDQEFINLLSLQ